MNISAADESRRKSEINIAAELREAVFPMTADRSTSFNIHAASRLNRQQDGSYKDSGRDRLPHIVM